ncbi:MAG: glycine cleavage system aminomethyltransferase GcvT [Gammaproteobacteria bacterium]|nr:glycine cleavage system aminomethyltransferase GcvT [Gammaproteobacteria bacterium]
MSTKTPLYDRHVAAGARMVNFGGWDMPLHYGSQIEEHHRVRDSAGIFDVSHMTIVDVSGAQSRIYLRRLLSNDVAKLADPGTGLYSCMLNDHGGVVDDLIGYRQIGDAYRLIVNAATRERDLAWMESVATDFELALREREDLIMLAVQGPDACVTAAPLLPGDAGEAALKLAPFACVELDGVFVARTGYTGEDGWEIILPVEPGLRLWDEMLAADITPCGLGARDTLRLEAGLNLYGQDMDEDISPLRAGLGWTVAWEPAERDFIGRQALEGERKQPDREKLVGLILQDRGIMRHGQRVITPAGNGIITSGGFSPTMQRSIALARIPAAATGDCRVEIRNAERPAKLVRPPFVRNGRILVDLT